MDAEKRLTPYHISLYLSLFRRWNLNFFKNPISIARDELMKSAKIGSVNTYTKCLKELDKYGFIRYEPSYNPHVGSSVYLYRFDKGSDKGDEIALRPFKNDTNDLNNSNMDKQAEKIDFKFKDEISKEETFAKASASEEDEQDSSRIFRDGNDKTGYGPDIPPVENHVKIYFDEKGYPSVEAEKFFNYFQSNGWLVGGRSKMKDWKAAARNWMLNAEKFKSYGKSKQNARGIKPGNLHAKTNTNYSEPL